MLQSDFFGHEISPGDQLVYWRKKSLGAMRVEIVLPDAIKGVSITGRRVTLRNFDRVAIVRGLDDQPKRRRPVHFR